MASLNNTNANQSPNNNEFIYKKATNDNFNLKNPLISTDLIYKNGQPVQQITFHNCITALKDYEHKSLEELRWEDYMLNRRFPIKQQQQQPEQPPPSRQAISRSTNPTNAINGTYLIQYKKTPGADIKTIDNKSFIYFDTTYASITAMNEYENKSFEELRFEDYSHGHKYPIKMQATMKQLITKPNDPVMFNSNKPDESIIDSCCPICLEKITNLKKTNIKLMVTTCGHIICKQCTTSLIKTVTNGKTNSGLFDCPTCRKKLNQSAIHDLYL